MNIAVGCPAYHRAWSLPFWFDHVERSFDKSGHVPTYVFVLAYDDDETKDVIFRRAGEHLAVAFVDQDTVSGRFWNEERYRLMVHLRNTLLGLVREASPDYFLSLDSDILLHEDVVENLVGDMTQFDAVAGKCFLTDVNDQGAGSTGYPNWANIGRTGQLQRQDADGTFIVDAIMAIKMMSPLAYNVDYAYDEQGEDIGWSKNCTSNGLKLGFDGRVASKHLMTQRALDVVDRRVGW